MKNRIIILLLLCTFQLIVAQPIGYASLDVLGQKGTTGGAGGPTVTVTNATEFLEYISKTEPYIIQVSGTISLPTGMYSIESDKTIIGLGKDAGFDGGGGLLVGLAIDNDLSAENPPANPKHNVIIRNLTFHEADDDCINVQMFSHHVWVDHCTFLSTFDGACDIKRGSSYCTVSYNRFVKIGKTCLLGHNDDNGFQDIGNLKVTYHHNWFDNCKSRMPRVRFGEPHVFNNYFDEPSSYAIGRGVEASVYSDYNYITSGSFSKDYGGGSLIDDGSIGGKSSGSVKWKPSDRYSYTPDKAEDVPSIVKANAGAGKLGDVSTLTPTHTPTASFSAFYKDEKVFIDFDLQKEMKVEIGIYTLMGKCVRTHSLDGKNMHINVENISNGTYICRLENSSGISLNKKIAIMR